MSELIHSDTAVKYNINNMPDINSLDNMLNLIIFCLQPLREILKKKIIITNGFRSCALPKVFILNFKMYNLIFILIYK